MPYFAPATATRAERLALAAARERAVLLKAPDLTAAVALQRQLIEIILDLADQIEHTGLPRLSLPPRYAAAKLQAGVPVLAGEPIPLPREVLIPGLSRLCYALSAGGAGEAPDHIREQIEQSRMDAGSVLSASLARDQHAIRQGAEHRGLSPDLLWLVAELAVSPFANALQRSILASAASRLELGAALEGWAHGYCPVCGSWPALAEAIANRRVLRCSFCALAWQRPSTAGCAYCGDQGDRFAIVPHNSRRDWHLELCGACLAYLKVLEAPELTPFPLVAIGDLETMDMDMAAAERGYARPGLRRAEK